MTRFRNIILAVWIGLLPATASAQVVSVVADRDTWIEQASPSTSHGSDTELQVRAEAGNSERTLFHFDVSALAPGTPIAAAFLDLTITAPDTTGNPVEIYRVDDIWNESTTWSDIADDFDGSTAWASFIPKGVVDGVHRHHQAGAGLDRRQPAQQWHHAYRVVFGDHIVLCEPRGGRGSGAAATGDYPRRPGEHGLPGRDRNLRGRRERRARDQRRVPARCGHRKYRRPPTTPWPPPQACRRIRPRTWATARHCGPTRFSPSTRPGSRSDSLRTRARACFTGLRSRRRRVS